MSTKADHPLKMLLDQIWNEGHTPRVIIDATHMDVIIPDWLRAQHKDHLVLDLKAADPMNFEFLFESFSADFAFSGTVVRCTIPWKRIVAIIDRDIGTGVRITNPEVLEAGAKKLAGIFKEEEPKPKTPVRKFGVIQGGKKN